ncbi:T9SS type A sorting domain-containing protein [Runella sp. CRIBMP]|uniref:T9SS type A sorting domain-containing protein n=1 Tax=Runella sp. CRIBMP TaxID=2683261 RepID=UPI001412228E|nr:T9SS type A sorting domain-containing protein [Runella sp. CRIBMP]
MNNFSGARNKKLTLTKNRTSVIGYFLTNTPNAAFCAKRLRCILLLTLLSCTAHAQLIGFPIAPTQAPSTAKNARTQAVSLPFFDDFSLTNGSAPSPALWIAGGGTYVNNTNTLNHPTVNVVTFDGANAAGQPYNLVNQNAQGNSDTLTSQPINLTGLTVADSIYLSFYWELRGLGEFPDADDSLRVQLLNDKGVWQTIWKQAGGVPNPNFNYVQLAIRNSAYFHANFQFRFQAFARQSGPFDSWHVDYVYLDKGRRLNRYIQDVSVSLPVSSFLKRYSAMPLKQYLANAGAETADSVFTRINNLHNIFNSTAFSYTLKDELSGRTFQTILRDNSVFIDQFSAQNKSVKPQAIRVDTNVTQRLSLVNRFQILTTDDRNPSIPGIDLRRNDSISGKTVLDDYYAYDDGTAEFAVYMNRTLGRTAVRYFLNKPDVVSAVRMNIVPILKDLTGQSITVQVWSNKDGRPGTVLQQKAFRVEYAKARNGFIEFPFDYGVAVRDTFYVGWLQIGTDGIAVGLDRNTQHEDQIFVNLGQEWAPYPSFKNDPNLAYFQGSLQVRPVMGGKALPPITSIEPEKVTEWEVYPNPSNGLIQWKSDEIQRIEIYHLTGALVRQQTVQSANKTMDLSELPNGLYLVRLSNDEKTVVKKILLQR